MINYKKAASLITEATNICVIQAGNLDGDSLASSLALEDVLGSMGKNVTMHCSAQVPRYLQFMSGWDRVEQTLDGKADLYIIVDTSSQELLEQTLAFPEASRLKTQSLLVIDHHNTESTLPHKNATFLVDSEAAATSCVLFNLFKEMDIEASLEASEFMAQSILSDTLGMMSEATTVETMTIMTELVRSGVKFNELEDRRRKLSKKSQRIVTYKAKLIERIEYNIEGRLALVIIPWEETQEYSDEYNPSALIIEEMRNIIGVDIAAVLKHYPKEERITCAIRAASGVNVADKLAEEFGGGGHPYASGFKVYGRQLDEVKTSLIRKAGELL